MISRIKKELTERKYRLYTEQRDSEIWLLLRGPHGKVSGYLCSPKVTGTAAPHPASVLGLQPSLKG